ncbi:energy-coupling factor ABC transporter ATP-binding protein [Zavarzinella formosa]|uniref:energy-coupling factor ABC transporter ATP-binding protein n=1 Tax=Zavarzinella formosa TaxID=360055 RepID=UPI0003194656|nr:ABC transporter ATP-binding protein [Zavarzinella formosa]
MIDVRELNFKYPDGRLALNGVSFHAEAGDRIGLIGPNGAGKTTLLLCLTGVLEPPANTIFVAGLDPANPTHRRVIPAHVGLVFQNCDDQIFSATVGEDVAFGPLNLGLNDTEVRQRVAEALATVNLTGFEDRVAFHLSEGEKRRVAIAGILAMRPDILLLDEPSSSLDPRGRRGLINLLKTLPGTQIIASHDLAMIRETCSRVILMDAGQVAAVGSIEMLRDKELLERHGLEI